MQEHVPDEDRPLVGIVDDDPALRRSLGRLLRSANLDVKLFASGDELLAYEERPRLRCLVLDLHLGDMTGLELLRRSRAANPDLPVVIVTGDLDTRLRVQALQEGAAAFLFKPIEDLRLLEEVWRALRPDLESAATPPDE